MTKQLESAILEVRALRASILQKQDLDGMDEMVKEFEGKIAEVDAILQGQRVKFSKHCVAKYRHIIHIRKHLKSLGAEIEVKI